MFLSTYAAKATEIFDKHHKITPKQKSALDDVVKQRKPFHTPETEEESDLAFGTSLKSMKDPTNEDEDNSHERSIEIDRTISAATDDGLEDGYEFSLRNSFHTVQTNSNNNSNMISKIERGKTNLLKAKTSSQLLSLVSSEVLDDKDKIASFISQLKSGEVATKETTEFRQRRLTYSQQTVEDEPSPMKQTPRVPKSRTTIFASSEIGVVQEKKPPFPNHILGTYSCHGIEPGLDENEPIHEKINQDRGCVVYPYNARKNEALFMVMDGHGEHGDKVSEFVMRQVRAETEVSVITLNPNFFFFSLFRLLFPWKKTPN
jgi:hypothetical protein